MFGYTTWSANVKRPNFRSSPSLNSLPFICTFTLHVTLLLLITNGYFTGLEPQPALVNDSGVILRHGKKIYVHPLAAAQWSRR